MKRTISVVVSIRAVVSTSTVVRRLPIARIVVRTTAVLGAIGFLLVAFTTLLISIPSRLVFLLASSFHLAWLLTRFGNCTDEVKRMGGMYGYFFADELLNTNKITAFAIVAKGVSNSTTACSCCSSNTMDVTFRFIR